MKLEGLRLNVATAEIFKCDPRILLITPKLSFHQIHAEAEEKAEKVRSKIRSRGHVRVQFVKQVLMPFWHLNCRSLVTYDRAAIAEIALHEANVMNVLLRDDTGKECVVVTNGARKAHVNVVERCEVPDGIEDYIDNSLSGRLTAMMDNLKLPISRNVAWKDYRLSNPKVISDVEKFISTGECGSEYIHLGYKPHRAIQIVKPIHSAEFIVHNATSHLSKILERKDIVPTRIVFAVETLDLYYRPLFVFEFSQLHNNAKEQKKQYLTIDGVTGAWDADVSATLNPLMNNDVRSMILLTTEIIGEFLTSNGGLVIIPVEIGKKIVQEALDKE